MNRSHTSTSRRRRTARRGVVVATVASALVGIAGPASADPGALDTSFGIEGRRLIAYGDDGAGITSEPVDSVRLARGRMLVAFNEMRGGAEHGVLRVFRPDGSVHENFGIGGEIDLGANTQIAAVARARNRFLVALTVQDPVSGDRWVEVRKFTASGRLDDNFSVDGIADPNSDHTSDHRAVDVTVDSEGRVVVLADNAALVGAQAYRLLKTGEPDSSFSGDGIAAPLMFGDANNFPRAVTTDASDRVVIAASALLDYDDGRLEVGTIVGRLTEAGEWDTTFSGDGQKEYGRGLDRQLEPADIAIDSRGRIVVVGAMSVLPADPRPQVAVIRLRPRGRMDASFSGDGVRTFRFDASGAEGVELDVLSGDRLFVTGNASGLLGVAMLDAAGRFDPSFSGDGTRTVRFGPSTSTLVATVLNRTASRAVLVGRYAGLDGGFGMVAVQLR